MVNNTIWNASLSTMWAINNFAHLSDFCFAAKEMGFAAIELNHQVNTEMLADLDLSSCSISSIHEPCPADIKVEELKNLDWLISAEDEENRSQGVLAIKRSIDLAISLGVKTIVVHAGNGRADWALEKKLFNVYTAGLSGTQEYNELKSKIEAERAQTIEPRLESVKKSLAELLEYCHPHGICLGLENRYHYLDIPLLGEMESLFELADTTELGFWYDAGHAHTLDRLGFIPGEDWLNHFSNRIVGVHLHDAIGTSDHQAPGQGEIDFSRIARVIPSNAVITLEIKPSTSIEQIKDSLRFLSRERCIEVKR